MNLTQDQPPKGWTAEKWERFSAARDATTLHRLAELLHLKQLNSWLRAKMSPSRNWELTRKQTNCFSPRDLVRGQLNGKPVSNALIMRKTGLSRSTVYRQLLKLEEKKLAVRDNTRWLAGALCLLLLPLLAVAGPFDHLKTNGVPKAIAAAPATYSATFAWDASTDAGVTNYSLFWGVKSGMYTNSVSTGTNRVRQVTGFAGGNYFAAVRAEARGTNSAFSNEIGFTLGPTSPPPRVITLSVESMDITVPNAPWITIWSTQFNDTIGNKFYRSRAQ